MNNLMVLENNNTISSLEVAEMVEKDHAKLLRDIRTYCKYLGEAKIGLSDYFIESTYKSEQNKELPSYDITKMGCEMIANKLTGKKGVIFTAKYVKKFNSMEMAIKDHQLLVASQRIEELEFSLSNMLQDFNESIEEAQFIKDWVFTTMGYTKWEDACAGDHKRILDIIGTVSRMLAINKITLI